MLPDANLLFYINLSGEVFYIISHRMKSQSVKSDLQQRVYNDLAVCICHPVVIQNLLKGSLQLLEMSMTGIDLRTYGLNSNIMLVLLKAPIFIFRYTNFNGSDCAFQHYDSMNDNIFMMSYLIHYLFPLCRLMHFQWRK